LRECGFKVIEAANSDEALTVLQEPDLTVDLVLSDAGIPGRMDGFGLSQWLRAHKAGMPIILVGSPGRAVEAAADLCEAGPMLARPYEPEILLDRIKRTLAERAPQSGSTIRRAGDGAIVYP
jgi:DNA-binding response OmpR family regulator